MIVPSAQLAHERVIIIEHKREANYSLFMARSHDTIAQVLSNIAKRARSYQSGWNARANKRQ
jgi:dsDNA-binding SOS-regulon protein